MNTEEEVQKNTAKYMKRTSLADLPIYEEEDEVDKFIDESFIDSRKDSTFYPIYRNMKFKKPFYRADTDITSSNSPFIMWVS